MSARDETGERLDGQLRFLGRYLTVVEAYQTKDADRLAAAVRDVSREFPGWAAAVCTAGAGAVQALMHGPIEPAEMRRLGQLVHVLQAAAARSLGGASDD